MKKNKTIKQCKSDSFWNLQDKVLIFSQCEEFRKKFIHIANKQFASLVHSQQSLDSFITKLHFTKYHVVYFDIDSIFYKLDGILTDISDSKNKNAEIYLVTSNIQNSYTLKKRNFPKNIFPLLNNGGDFIHLLEDRVYTY